MPNMKQLLEQSTNVAIIVVAGVICWSLLSRHVRRQPEQTDVGAEQSVGMSLPSMPGYSWGRQPETLIMAIRVGCHYCANSMPFYRHLSSLEESHRLKAHLVIAMQEDSKAEDHELLSDRLNLDHVFGQSFTSLKVTGTPTLTLVDSHGLVKKVWIGQLSPEGEQDVMSSIGE
jgi:hypothetical protein